jgi:serine phosphatase RsbU (regulator of sigma subunit)
MKSDEIESEAFQIATLKSESYRIIGVLCVLGALLPYVIVRALISDQLLLLPGLTLVLVLAIVSEATMLVLVRRALKNSWQVSSKVLRLNVFLETQVPTVALLLLIESRIVGPYQALVAPAMLLYFIVIILSTLRLSPALSLWTGFLSSSGYLVVFVYTVLTYGRPDPRLVTFPIGIYLVYGALIMIGGIVAAFVASQVRTHVLAALREAELNSKLEQVRHDLDVARSIQQGLLPTRSPNLEEFELAGWNQPADQTGGDYFDWQALPDGKLAISLGDATGHGIGPALVSASCRAYARASFLSSNGNNGLLDRLNGLLAEDLSSNRFVTFAVVFLDPVRSQVKVLSAGHGPILCYHHDTDQLENLEAQGIPLGMLSGFKYEHATEKDLERGDMLVLVTDGFFEWENPEGEEFGLARLEEVIHESRDCSAEEIIARLRSAVHVFCRGTEQKDDLTAVILKRKKKSI